eukprot:GHVH01004202.1.p1 GENE.GHVH01004202.1~~GHVH01004202.1.p1  ORF type:complete len:2115 (+),score=268.82 GHVH01004202.1:819-7163(+)
MVVVWGFALSVHCARFYDLCCPFRKRKDYRDMGSRSICTILVCAWLWVLFSVLCLVGATFWTVVAFRMPEQMGTAFARGIPPIYDLLWNPDPSGWGFQSLTSRASVVDNFFVNSVIQTTVVNASIYDEPSVNPPDPRVMNCTQTWLGSVDTTGGATNDPSLPLATGRGLPLERLYLDPSDPFDLSVLSPFLDSPIVERINAADYFDAPAEVTAWPCQRSTPYVDDIRSILYKRFGWSHLAKMMHITNNPNLPSSVFGGNLYYGLPMKCHGGECRQIQALDVRSDITNAEDPDATVDHHVPTKPASWNANFLGFTQFNNGVPKEYQAADDKTTVHPSAERVPVGYFAQSRDVHGTQTPNHQSPADNQFVSVETAPSLLAEILNGGMIEGPNLLGISLTSPLQSLSGVNPKEIGRAYPSEVAPLALRAINIAEHHLYKGINECVGDITEADGGGVEVSYGTSIDMNSWLGEPVSYVLNTLLNDEMFDGAFQPSIENGMMADQMCSLDRKAASLDCPSGKLSLMNDTTTVGLFQFESTRRTFWPRHDKTVTINAWLNFWGGSIDDYPVKTNGSLARHSPVIRDYLDNKQVYVDANNDGKIDYDSIDEFTISLNDIESISSKGTFGWIMNSDQFEHPPFMYYIRLHSLFEALIWNTSDTFASEKTNPFDWYTDQVFSGGGAWDFLWSYLLYLVYQPLWWEGDEGVEWAEETASHRYRIHHWTLLTSSVLLICTIVVYFIIFSFFMTMQYCMMVKRNKRKRSKNSNSFFAVGLGRHSGIQMRLTLCAMSWNVIVHGILGIAGVYAIAFMSELQAICEDDLVAVFIPNTTDEDPIGASSDSYDRCIKEGIPFEPQDYSKVFASSAYDSLQVLSDKLIAIMDNSSWIEAEEYLRSPDLSQFEMPIPSISHAWQTPQKGADGVVRRPAVTMSMKEYMIQLEAERARGIIAASNGFDRISLMSPRGLYGTDEDGDIINIGYSDSDTYISALVDPKLVLVNINVTGAFMSVNDEASELLSELVENSFKSAEDAVELGTRSPVWLHGNNNNIGGYTSLDPIDDRSFYLMAGLSAGSASHRELWPQYSKDFRRLHLNHRYAKYHPSVELDWTVPREAAKSKSITHWSVAVHEWLEELYGGAQELKKPLADRGFCSARYLKDICVLGLNSSGVEVPMAGYCSLPELVDAFDVTLCANRHRDASSPMSGASPYACIRPMRNTSDPRGDVVTDRVDDMNDMMKRRSGLINYMVTQGNGRQARWMDLSCPLFCNWITLWGEEDPDSGSIDGWLGDYDGLGEKPYFDQQRFGSITWSAKDGAALAGYRSIPGDLFALAPYRECLLPSGTQYLIGRDYAADNVFEEHVYDASFLPFLQFMATVERVQALTTQAATSYLRAPTVGQIGANNSQIINDLNNFPSVDDVSKPLSSVKDEILEKVVEKASTAKTMNDIFMCQDMAATVTDYSKVVCLIPFGLVQSTLVWHVLLAILFIIFYPLAFKIMHYFRDRNNIDMFGGLDAIELTKLDDPVTLDRLFEFDKYAIIYADTNENQCLHWAAELGRVEIVDICLEHVKYLSYERAELEERQTYKKELQFRKDEEREMSSQNSMHSMVSALKDKVHGGEARRDQDFVKGMRQFSIEQDAEGRWSRESTFSDMSSEGASERLRRVSLQVKREAAYRDKYAGVSENVKKQESQRGDDETRGGTLVPYQDGMVIWNTEKIEGGASLYNYTCLFMSQVPPGSDSVYPSRVMSQASSVRNYVNQRNEYGYSPLHCAALQLAKATMPHERDNYKIIIDRLLAHYADINTHDNLAFTPLGSVVDYYIYHAPGSELAARDESRSKEGHSKIEESVLPSGGSAVERSREVQKDTLEFLLQRGADPNALVGSQPRRARYYTPEAIGVRVPSVPEIESQRKQMIETNKTTVLYMFNDNDVLRKTGFDYGQPRLLPTEEPTKLIELDGIDPEVKGLMELYSSGERTADKAFIKVFPPMTLQWEEGGKKKEKKNNKKRRSIISIDSVSEEEASREGVKKIERQSSRVSLSSEWNYAEWVDNRMEVFKDGAREQYQIDKKHREDLRMNKLLEAKRRKKPSRHHRKRNRDSSLTHNSSTTAPVQAGEEGGPARTSSSSSKN